MCAACVVACLAVFLGSFATTAALVQRIVPPSPLRSVAVFELPVLAEDQAPFEASYIDIVMVGDILMHDGVVDHGLQWDGTYDYGFIFRNTSSFINQADVRILNQETVMGFPENGYSMVMEDGMSPVFNSPLALADAEVAAGFNVILKATNHVYDQGYDGLGHELSYWRANYPGIPVLGVDNPWAPDGAQDYVDNVYMCELGGVRIAILNYTFGTNVYPDYANEHVFTSYLNEDKIRYDVYVARAMGADIVVACPHWGVEYQVEPSYEELYYSSLFCELGVDVVFGTHPHIMQPVEVLVNAEGHRTVCFYSNGNFVASGFSDPRSLVAGISRVTVTKDEDGTARVVAASLVPVLTCYAPGDEMGVYPVANYPDEYAWASYRPDLTAQYVSDFCAALFGEGYDREQGVYTVNLG